MVDIVSYCEETFCSPVQHHPCVEDPVWTDPWLGQVYPSYGDRQAGHTLCISVGRM